MWRALKGRTSVSPPFFLRVKTISTARPLSVRPIALNRSSIPRMHEIAEHHQQPVKQALDRSERARRRASGISPGYPCPTRIRQRLLPFSYCIFCTAICQPICTGFWPVPLKRNQALKASPRAAGASRPFGYDPSGEGVFWPQTRPASSCRRRRGATLLRKA